MKKIGIVTYWDTKDNYGSILQNYALQAFLKTRGFEPDLIRIKANSKNMSSAACHCQRKWYMFPSSTVHSNELDSFRDHLKERKFVAQVLPDTKEITSQQIRLDRSSS